MQKIARIDLSACVANCRTLKKKAGQRKLFAVVKDDAYGHGLQPVAQALDGEADGLCVFAGADATILRAGGYQGPILVMGGFADSAELEIICQAEAWPVVHNRQQAQIMADGSNAFERVAVKVNTGMNRLGLAIDEAEAILGQIAEKAGTPLLMTHFACADVSGGVDQQAEIFNKLAERLDLPATCCNTAATCLDFLPCLGEEFVRCGIGIYGASPVAGRPAAEFGLRAAMELSAPVCDARILEKGEGVGYGNIWQAREKTAVAVVNIGYGDGYSRLAVNAPVRIGNRACRTVGRISMDLTIVETGLPPVQVGQTAQMWGKEVPVDAVAESAGTIGYELLAGLSGRIIRLYQ